MEIFESAEERRARYIRMAIAAAAAAARSPMPEVQMAYLLMAESWSSLAKSESEEEGFAAANSGGLATPTEHREPPITHR
jgi:hypothetical protein